jgi:hypothetical protein
MSSPSHLLLERLLSPQCHPDLPPAGGLTIEVRSDGHFGENDIVRMLDCHHRIEKKQ